MGPLSSPVSSTRCLYPHLFGARLSSRHAAAFQSVGAAALIVARSSTSAHARARYCVHKLTVFPSFLGMPLLAPRIESLFIYPGKRTCSLDIIPACDVKDNEVVDLLYEFRRSPYISH